MEERESSSDIQKEASSGKLDFSNQDVDGTQDEPSIFKEENLDVEEDGDEDDIFDRGDVVSNRNIDFELCESIKINYRNHREGHNNNKLAASSLQQSSNNPNPMNQSEFELINGIIDKQNPQMKDQLPFILNIQMQYCKESLKDFLQNQQKVDTIYNFKIFKQLIETINFIHQKCKIIHRDLKPANIFMQDDVIQIGDFGLATDSIELKRKNSIDEQHLSFDKESVELSLTRNIGTPGYMAPELEANEYYDDKVDIFALGLIMFEMFFNFSTKHERFLLMSNLSKQH